MDKEIKVYLAEVRRRLNLSKEMKGRCVSDLQTTINARLESGESWPEIEASLGAPKKVAEELNEQMKEFACRKSPWRFAFLAAAVLSGGWLAFYAGMQLVLQLVVNDLSGVGIIGGADGPTAIFVATSPGPDWDLIIMGAILIVGIAGFLRLRKCKPKK